MSGRLVGWLRDGKRLNAPLGNEARIGSADNSDVVVAIKGVSRAQARIVRDGASYWIEDAGSKNGTLVNGVAVVRSALHHLDVVSLGRVIDLVFVQRGDAPASAGAAPMVFLERMEGSTAPIQVAAGVLTVGRADDAGLVIESSMVSRNHARVSNQGNRVTVEDLNSANGTSINGRRITAPTVLRDGDIVEFGDNRFRVRITSSVPADAAPAAPQPAAPIVAAAEPDTPKPDQEWKTRIVFLGDVAEGMPSELRDSRRPGVKTGVMPPAADAPTAGPAVATRAVAPAAPVASAKTVAPAAPEAPKTAFAPLDVLMAPKLGGTVAPEPPGSPPAGPRTVFGGSLDLNLPAGLGATAEPAAADVPMTVRIEPPATRIRAVRLRGTSGTFLLNSGLSRIGRAPDSQVVLNDRDVSRWHASITVTPDSVTVEDRDSANGTLVDGKAIKTPTRLESGSTVSFGQVEFSIELLLEGRP
jgi:pSer/pThr/pTyr-binding forkhead associated (FHA) protein